MRLLPLTVLGICFISGTAAASETTALEKALELHGWPCDAIADWQVDPPWTAVTCADGNSYEIFLRDDWDWRETERQTQLQPMLGVGWYVARLGAENPATRGDAAVALGQLGPAASAAIPALTEALSDPDPGVREHVAEALAAIGEP
ncbi:MAG: HEAT repeat domain-containing protein [Pseudomonadota bacterium]